MIVRYATCACKSEHEHVHSLHNQPSALLSKALQSPCIVHALTYIVVGSKWVVQKMLWTLCVWISVVYRCSSMTVRGFIHDDDISMGVFVPSILWSAKDLKLGPF